MLNFDLHISVSKYDESTGTRNPDVDIGEREAAEIQDYLEFAIKKTPYIVTDLDDVFVFDVEDITKVVCAEDSLT